MRRTSPQGFTLIELIIYLGIVSIMLVSLSYLIIDIVSSQTKNISIDDVRYEARFLEDRLRHDIEHASAITSVTASTLQLVTPEGAVQYRLDASAKTLSRQVGAQPEEALTLKVLSVTGAFTDVSYQNRVKQIETALLVTRRNPGNLSDYQASTTLDLFFDLRGRR